MTLVEAVYVVAGIALPAYYLPQILRCASDDTLLASYSMSKAATQWALRAAMLPFVFGVGNSTMTWVVSLDFLGRSLEFGVALRSLHLQGLDAREILERCFPVRWLLGRLRSERQAQAPDAALPAPVAVSDPSIVSAAAIVTASGPFQSSYAWPVLQATRRQWTLHPLVEAPVDLAGHHERVQAVASTRASLSMDCAEERATVDGGSGEDTASPIPSDAAGLQASH